MTPPICMIRLRGGTQIEELSSRTDHGRYFYMKANSSLPPKLLEYLTVFLKPCRMFKLYPQFSSLVVTQYILCLETSSTTHTCFDSLQNRIQRSRETHMAQRSCTDLVIFQYAWSQDPVSLLRFPIEMLTLLNLTMMKRVIYMFVQGHFKAVTTVWLMTATVFRLECIPADSTSV